MSLDKFLVKKFGDVKTPPPQARQMLSLVGDELQRPDSRFFEPSCGDGNFLSLVLREKLKYCQKRYYRKPHELASFSFICLASLYGIDIQDENVIKTRGKLSDIFLKATKNSHSAPIVSAVKHVLSKNILTADTLLIQETDTGLVFSQWAMIGTTLIQRQDFRFYNLAAPTSFKAERTDEKEKSNFVIEPIKKLFPSRRIQDLVLDA